jgi:nucleotide-binding universal stress UspA family protein
MMATGTDRTMLDRILVGLDGSPLGEAILPLVERLATALPAEVVLLHVTHLPGEVASVWQRLGLAPEVELSQTRASAYLDEQRQRLAARGVTARTALAVGDAADEIVAHARGGHTLIAISTHGRTGARRWVHGSVMERVLRGTSTPLLVVRPAHGGTGVVPTVGRVVVCLDGSARAQAAVPTAVTLASALAVPLVGVRVVEYARPSFLVDPEGEFSARIVADLRRAAVVYLEQVLRDTGVATEAVALVGSSADAIVQYARAQAGSLLVLTTHGRAGVPRVLMGSVALRVLLQATDPVVLLRPEGPPD